MPSLPFQTEGVLFLNFRFYYSMHLQLDFFLSLKFMTFEPFFLFFKSMANFYFYLLACLLAYLLNLVGKQIFLVAKVKLLLKLLCLSQKSPCIPMITLASSKP